MYHIKYCRYIPPVALAISLAILIPGCEDKPTEPSSDPTSLSILLGESQTGVVGRPLDHDFVVKVTDASGGPVSGVTVNFAVLSGDGYIYPSRITTDKLGLAATTHTLGPVPGLNEVCAFASGLDSVVFAATAYNSLEITGITKEINSIQVGWSHEPTEGFEAYEIYRTNVPNPFYTIAPDYTFEEPSTHLLLDYSITQDSTYYYRVAARYTGGHRLISDLVTVTAGFRFVFDGTVNSLMLDTTRNLLYATNISPGDIYVISPANFQLVRCITLGVLLGAADLTGDCSTMHISTRYQDILTYATGSWTLLNQGNISEFTTRYSSSIYTNWDGRVFFAGGGVPYSPNYVIMMEPEKDYLLTKVNSNFGLVNGGVALALRNPPDALYLLESTNRLIKLDLTQPDVPYVWLETTDRDLYPPFFISPDESTLIFSNGVFIDPQDASTVNQLPVLGRPVMSFDETRLYYLRPGMLTAVDAQTLDIIDSVEVDVASIQGAAMSPSDTLMYIVGDNNLRMVDVRPFISQ